MALQLLADINQQTIVKINFGKLYSFVDVKKVKFSELSKSGKVLNVFNAMQMAGEMSKKKK
jgi:hypothetical protein